MRRPLLAALTAAILLAGCSTDRGRQADYTAYRAARPQSLLVLPPLDRSLEAGASAAVWAQASRPLAEAGYYVLPVTLVDGMLRGNGVSTPADAAGIAPDRLRSVFGADAAVYIEVLTYGTSYAVVSSGSTVELTARMIDLRSGAELWRGHASGRSRSDVGGSGIVGVLVAAVANQIVQTASDTSFAVAAETCERLFAVDDDGGLLPGPRLPPSDARP